MTSNMLLALALVITCANDTEKEEVPIGPEGREYQAHYDRIMSLAFSPNGKLLASASLDGTISLWDMTRREDVGRIQAHKDGVFSVAFSPDGKLLASAGVERLVRLWDVTTHKEIRQFRGHEDKIASVAFAPDGKLLASGSYDKTIRLWDVATGKALRVLKGHEVRVTSVVFSPDGKQLVSGGPANASSEPGTTTNTILARMISCASGTSPMEKRCANSPSGVVMSFSRRMEFSWLCAAM